MQGKFLAKGYVLMTSQEGIGTRMAYHKIKHLESFLRRFFEYKIEHEVVPT